VCFLQGLEGGSAGLFYEGKGTTWEGGMRAPGIFWQPGRIPAGTIAYDVASHVDLLPTIAAAAGAALGPNPLDGVDLTPVLYAGGAGSRQYLFYWRGEDQSLPNGTVRSGLWAARNAAGFKAHFVTKSGYGPDAPVFHSPPLLFNLHWDPSELFPLDTTVPAFAAAAADLLQAAAAHHASVSHGEPDQCSVSDPAFGLCGDPTCRYCPGLPNCTTTPDNWSDYAYPEPQGFPDPSDRRVPIDPVSLFAAGRQRRRV